MDNFLLQIFNLLTSPPGNLIYHLGLVFSIAGALQVSITPRQPNVPSQNRRTTFGLAVLLAAQVILFLGSGLSWQGIFNSSVILPPLDRAVIALSLLWIVWLWAYPQRVPTIEALHIFLNILVVIFLAITLAFWSDQNSKLLFTATWFDFIWDLFCSIIVLSGMLALLIRKPASWEMGVGMLALIGLGFAAQLSFSFPPSDFLGAVRLALLAAYPLLWNLPLRSFQTPGSAPESSKESVSLPAAHPITHERRRYSTDPKTLQAFLDLCNQADAAQRGPYLVRLMAHVMVADLCYLVSIPDSNGQVTLASGYDLIREEELLGMSLKGQDIPQMTSALQKGHSLRLSEEAAPLDLHNLGKAIGLNHTGNMLLVPLLLENQPPLGGLILLSPYSNRSWSGDDQNYLLPALPGLAKLLTPTHGLSPAEIEQLRTDLQDAHEEIDTLRSQQADMIRQLNIFKEEEDQRNAQEENLAALVAVQQEYQALIEQLQQENGQLQTALKQAAPSQEFPNEPILQLQDTLSPVAPHLAALEQMGAPTDQEHAEVIASIAQELRQPLSSIAGYTDLLLGESIGILGALQRKFLERIHASSERMRCLVDDLIQTMTLANGTVSLNQERINLSEVIDQAILSTSAQMREKNISLQVDLPPQLPWLHADKDALQQVLIHLLQNAGSVSPLESTVQLKVRTESEDDQQDYVILQITDAGGGISPQDLPRVFSRLYRADSALIQGVGETGVGLSIAKTLVEAQGGRIWVDTQKGETSTFSILLPIYLDHSDRETVD